MAFSTKNSILSIAKTPVPHHHLPALMSGFFGGKKNIKCSLPANNHQDTSRINSFHLPSNEMTLMRMIAMVAIHLIWLLW
jgi:hypothetical protein